MAVPPMVPTSFVPRSPSSSPSSFRPGNFDFGGAFAFLGYGAFVLALMLAGGVLAYDWFLKGVEASKREELQIAEAEIDSATVESFMHLRDRLSESKRLLSSHLMLGNVFALFETLSPRTVRLVSLQTTFSNSNSGLLTSSGTAASFNALAAFSTALGKDGSIKNAVFSSLTIERSGSVSFTLTADIDPALVAFAVTPGATSENVVPENVVPETP